MKGILDTSQRTQAACGILPSSTGRRAATFAAVLATSCAVMLGSMRPAQAMTDQPHGAGGSLGAQSPSQTSFAAPSARGPRLFAPPNKGTSKIPERAEDRATSAGGDTYSTNYMYNQKNGAVQTDPRVYLIYWGDWNTDTVGAMNKLYYMYSGIGGSSWGKVMAYYQQGCTAGTWNCTGAYAGNPTGVLKKWFKDTSAVPATPTQAQVEAEALKYARNVVGDYSLNAQYVVALSPGHGDTQFKAGTACAWHYWTRPTSTTWVTFTALPYQPDNPNCYRNWVNTGSAGYADGVTMVAGHEYAESVTDPGINAWYDINGKENGDKCAGYGANVTLSTGTFAMQPTWSNYSRYYKGYGCVYSG